MRIDLYEIRRGKVFPLSVTPLCAYYPYPASLAKPYFDVFPDQVWADICKLYWRVK